MPHTDKVMVSFDNATNTTVIQVGDQIIPNITDYSLWGHMHDGKWSTTLNMTQEQTNNMNELKTRVSLEWDSSDAKLKDKTQENDEAQLRKLI